MHRSSAAKKSQRHQYELSRSNLQPKRLLVLMDFTSAQLSTKPGGDKIVQDCIIVAEYIEHGQLQRINYDFLCDDESNKNDYHFVLAVWVWLFMVEKLKDRFEEIEIWTDGGPHHFKTKYCQFMWHALSTLRFDRKRMIHNFFASYHGGSLADGHAAHVKKIMHSQYKISWQQRLSRCRDALYWGPSSASEIAALVSQRCANTRAHVFPDIDRTESNKPSVNGINSIKTMHSFVYENGTCRAAKGTRDETTFPFSF